MAPDVVTNIVLSNGLIPFLCLWGTTSDFTIVGRLESLDARLRLQDELDESPGVPVDHGGIRVLGCVEAGFLSPAEEELVDTLSLDDLLIQNKEATFLLRVSGDSMTGASILPGDMVIVDRGMIAKIGDIVIAQVDGE